MSASSAASTERVTFSIPSLDGIRALSFFAVFLSHVGVPGIPGGFGVTVFFFLSGYLITTLLRRETERTQRISLKLFYLRRVLRILPPFYVILSLALLLQYLGLLPERFSLSGLVSQALHYSNYWIIENGWAGLIAGTGVYWSLAVEEHFYLIFPALYQLMIKCRATPRAQHACLLGLCAAVLAWRCWIVFGTGVIGDRTYVASDTRFDSMLFGCALAVWGNPALDLPRIPRPGALELAAALAGLALLGCSFLIRDPAFRESLRYTLQGVGLYALFFVAVRCPNWGPCRVLNLPALRFVGTLSYSLYLLHHLTIYIVYAHLSAPAAVQALLALGLSMLGALVIWRLVEQPCARLRSKFGSGTPLRPALN